MTFSICYSIIYVSLFKTYLPVNLNIIVRFLYFCFKIKIWVDIWWISKIPNSFLFSCSSPPLLPPPPPLPPLSPPLHILIGNVLVNLGILSVLTLSMNVSLPLSVYIISSRSVCESSVSVQYVLTFGIHSCCFSCFHEVFLIIQFRFPSLIGSLLCWFGSLSSYLLCPTCPPSICSY